MRQPGRTSLVFRVIQFRRRSRHAISEPGCEGRFEWTMALPAGLVGPITLEAYVAGADGHEALADGAATRDRVT